jgi:hypothetical protein
MMGTALKGLRYEPLFPYFQHLADSDGAFVVMLPLHFSLNCPLHIEFFVQNCILHAVP